MCWIARYRFTFTLECKRQGVVPRTLTFIFEKNATKQVRINVQTKLVGLDDKCHLTVLELVI